MSDGAGIMPNLIQDLDHFFDLGEKGIEGAESAVFHHVGVAVSSIHALWEEIGRTIGAEPDSPVLADPIQKVSALFLVNSLGYRVELIEPIGDESPISRFLQKTGGGPHHLCFETGNFDADFIRLKTEGARVVCQPIAACGFHGARIAFCYTRQRMLVELVESPVVYDRISCRVAAQVRQ
ncbi:MAG: VOC family protein [Nitrospira sp.]|jgi:methylmalonyl-CoA/ethylmalonyl-CoA epimerase